MDKILYIFIITCIILISFKMLYDWYTTHQKEKYLFSIGFKHYQREVGYDVIEDFYVRNGETISEDQLRANKLQILKQYYK